MLGKLKPVTWQFAAQARLLNEKIDNIFCLFFKLNQENFSLKTA